MTGRDPLERQLLIESEQVLTAVWKELLAIKPLLTTPYPSSSGTTPWDRRTHEVARSAHDLSMKLRMHLRSDPHAGHDTCTSCSRCRDCGGQHDITCGQR